MRRASGERALAVEARATDRMGAEKGAGKPRCFGAVSVSQLRDSGCEAGEADLTHSTVRPPRRPANPPTDMFAGTASPTAAPWGGMEAPGGMRQVGGPQGVWAGPSEASTPPSAGEREQDS